ncbi:MBL fold metallo-hydrolase [Streptomyces turgidiscabies]|uniref:Metallo-beta-lactamase domain protein n=1 Tax=Streptomyces turgidiscabies (strain Car8) TaxID=698760 RepID=L7FFW2_STRT8|nr:MULTISPECIES: MBL fold metallo-hydrolase [Streptomyces]ELP70293.1 metallo-beta-lactamase domain protein [Streptomyces turgidiscabies Car8]MDX3496495.1 MBL fold metallo-hydrolase [Streptomyces turgidiscabies]GAQ72684.1 metallo-beta-lactamase superfamily protein [Streptomyces turgidiscabies]
MASATSLTGRIGLGNGCHAWIAGAAGWGMSNAGLITGRGESLLVDTLYDLRLTQDMLDGLAPLTGTAPISTVVNTHGNGDHWFGNQLVAQAEIIAARGSLADMRQVGPAEMRALTGMATPAGRFAGRIFGRFDHTGIEPVLPSRVFDGETVLDVGGTEVRLFDVGPAHSTGDTVVHVPQARTVYTGDIVFARATPIVWHGPFARWLAACDLLLGLDADTVVPGHGPVTTRQTVREIRDYLEFVHEQATARFTAGMPFMDAARDIPLGRFADLGESERLAVNVHTVYRELDPELPPLDGPGLFGCMAELCPDV